MGPRSDSQIEAPRDENPSETTSSLKNCNANYLQHLVEGFMIILQQPQRSERGATGRFDVFLLKEGDTIEYS